MSQDQDKVPVDDGSSPTEPAVFTAIAQVTSEAMNRGCFTSQSLLDEAFGLQ